MQSGSKVSKYNMQVQSVSTLSMYNPEMEKTGILGILEHFQNNRDWGKLLTILPEI